MILADRNRTRTAERPTVCLIGQNDRSRDIIVDLIDSHGLEVENFDLAEDFLRTFDAIDVAFIVLDLDLPAMCGMDLQLRLFSAKIHFPVIVTCNRARSDIDSVVAAFKLGAIDFIETPFLAREMVTAIQKAIECRSIQSQRAYLVSCMPTS